VVNAKCDTRSPIIVSFQPPRPANAIDPHNQPRCKRQHHVLQGCCVSGDPELGEQTITGVDGFRRFLDCWHVRALPYLAVVSIACLLR
jgi:hypothetical protein